MLKIYDLKTEHLKNPRGMDASNPRFSWKLKSNRQGVRQISYRIIVDRGREQIWDSQVVQSSESQNVRYGGKMLSSRQEIIWKVEVTAEDEHGVREQAVSEIAWFETGLLEREDWIGKWIEPETEVDHDARKPAPYLRRTFTVKRGLKKARIYQTAHGLYHFWINGISGTEDCFKPGLTSYYHRIQYQVYDIAPFLKEGENVWAVMLADGWWRGVTGGTVRNNFGYKLHYLGQIELEYEDGTKEVIGTDESFRYGIGGLLASDMQMGDIYDAGAEPDGWKTNIFDDNMWKTVHLMKEQDQAERIASRSVPVREKERFIPNVLKDADGRTVLDLGQNIAGYVKMRLRGCKKGQKIVLTHGEDMKDGRFSIENISDTSFPMKEFQQVIYISGGAEEETYCPMFAIFGFRYVLVEGYEGEILPGDFVGIAVYSDMEETGTFQCSNPLINQLVKNARWSQKGNFMDVAVDCPTRERNSWTGDAQIYTKTAAWFMDIYSFYEKWMQDQSIEQYASGKLGITFPSTSSVHNPEELKKMKTLNPSAELAGPAGNGNIGEDCAGWGDAAAWIPVMNYLCYGDKQIIKNQYGTAKRWVDYMLACAKEHNPLYEDQPQYHHRDTDGELDAEYIYDTRMHYGEWVEPIPKEPTGESIGEIFARWFREGKPLVATAYMCRSAQNVSDMAKVLGKQKEAEQYQKIADKVRRVYDKYLIGEDGEIEPGHQAAYVRALAFDLAGEKKKPLVVRQLLKEIEANDYRLNTGFLSTPFLLPVLVDTGHIDTAFRILEQTENPSWLHAVQLGATTILENWDGMDQHRSSYNHYSFGAVCDFLFGYVAGIRPSWQTPGYEKFILKPVVGGTLTHAEAVYESRYGTIRSAWKTQGEKRMHYECEIPVNTVAILHLPDGSTRELGSGKYEYETEEYEMKEYTLKSDQKCIPIQKMVFEKMYLGEKVNSFQPRNMPGIHIRENGIVYRNDVCYGITYPNSFLDIWYPDADLSVKRPTVFYIHGGGFIFGDKVSGDPLAAGVGRDVDFCAEIARRGYNVVSPNYALAPEYRFPVQLEQVNEMLEFLTEHQEEYGLDMSRIFLGGGSAGADLSEIYGALLCSPEYANVIGIVPKIKREQILGLLIDEAALSVRHFEENMNAMLGCWLGMDEPSQNGVAEEKLDAAKWIRDTYIPSFINSSNQEIWFLDSAENLVSVLEKNGTDYEFFYRGPECDSLEHGYMQRFANNPYAKECLEHLVAFMKRQEEKNR